MSAKERRRVEVMSRVRDGQVSVAVAAGLLGVSERQAWRLKQRYATGGDGGLVHTLRGRASNNKTAGAARSAVLKAYRLKYAGFGPTLACEYLLKDGGHAAVSHDTLGRWLREEGLFEKRRKRGKHRLRRPRRACAGELVQMDGSWHDWLEGRGPWCCLMVMIDDATGRVTARFYEKETLNASFDLFGRYVKARWLPRALYVDKAGIYRAEAGCPPTQFGRAMGELGVELILANSPQAKGRVERMNGTLQDRLVKELRLRGVRDMVAANGVLDDEGPFLKQFNAKFAVKAAKRTDVHVKVRAALKLDEVLCEREERAVGHDWCVQWHGRLLQIDARHAALNLPRVGRRVTVIEKASGDLLVRYAGAVLMWAEVSTRPAPAKAKRARKPVTNNQRWLPGSDHPFKRPLIVRSSAATARCGVRPSSATPPRA